MERIYASQDREVAFRAYKAIQYLCKARPDLYKMVIQDRCCCLKELVARYSEYVTWNTTVQIFFDESINPK
jgi:hypothetical protein